MPPVDSPPQSRLIEVSIDRQILTLSENGVLLREWPVSTASRGAGFEPGSFTTPTGRFRIAEKIGTGAPLGAAFRSRLATGKIIPQGGGEDAILTRILWLDGLDAENANTRERFIYIHGTNREDLIGTPASHGCVRMKNADVAELHDLVRVGDPVWIAPPSDPLRPPKTA